LRSLGIYRLGEKEVVVLRFDAQVLEDGILPEALHVILRYTSVTNNIRKSNPHITYPVVDLPVPYGVIDAVSCSVPPSIVWPNIAPGRKPS